MCCRGINLCAEKADRCEAIVGPEVSPPTAEVPVGRTLQFTSPPQGVTWEVEEGLFAGSIEPSGLYFAPVAPGLFHVIARSKIGATRIPVTVRELRLSVLAGRPGGPASTPIDGLGPDARVAGAFGNTFLAGSYFFLDSTPDLPEPSLVLRRYDSTTQRLETLFEEHPERSTSVDGPRGTAVFRHLDIPSVGGPRSLLGRRRLFA